jgi:rare lipoprotein A (RlpA)-like double-psi beta-barrel protein
VRRSMAILLGLVLLASAGVVSSSASAGPGTTVDELLARARSDRTAATEAVRLLEIHVDALTAAYGKAERQLQGAALRVLAAYRNRLILSAELAEAQDTLDGQAASVYEAGPALPLELMLGSRSPADIASVQEFAARAIGLGSDAVDRVKALRTEMGNVAGDLQRRQDELAGTAAELRRLALHAMDQLAKARDVAASAGLEVTGLKERRRALDRVQTLSDSTIAALVDAQRGVDQSKLLELLGPNQGRGCEIPVGLDDTGQRIDGIASWYGPGFAGRPTASGAIYDPRLFTAANKELPLNTFLRVHFNGRCAVVLVNDRGPYAPGRVFDLSQATAEYLGLGLGPVTSDVLIPI